MGQNGHENGADPKSECDKQIGTQIRKRIGEFLILLIYLVIDAFEIWPHSHIGALVAFVPGLIALMLLDGEFSNKSIISVAVGTSAVSILIYLLVGPVADSPTVGWLQPANELTPANECDKVPANVRPVKSPVILIGNVGFIPSTSENYDAIEIGQCALAFRQTTEGAAITTDLYSLEGKLIGRLRDNGYSVAGDERLAVERSGDLSTIVVHDRQGTELLYVRVLNRDTIRLRGTFSCPHPRFQTIRITDKSIIDQRNNTFSLGCIIGGRVGMKFN